MAISVQTPYGTLAFPVLFSPRPRAENAKPVFSCTILFSPEEQKSKEYKDMQEAVRTVAVDDFGPSVKFSSLVLPFRDAGEKQYNGYLPGWTYITPWANPEFRKIGIVDGRLQDVLDPAEVWPGQIVRALVEPFTWTNTGRKGVSFGLVHIQIVKKDAPRLDGRVPANRAFTAIPEEADMENPF